MKIEEKDYTKEEFKNYLITHSEKIFEEDLRKSWLKIYCLLVSDDSWKEKLFEPDEIKQLGQIYKVKLREESNSEGEVEESIYYISEYQKGLLLLYTSANQETYEKNLGKKIARSVGVAKMWISPQLFNTYWDGILKDTSGYVYRFTSKRESIRDLSCKIRPDYTRRFNYTGDDATQTIEELVELYGVVPNSIYIQAETDLKIHLTNEGLYSAQEASAKALNLFYKYLDKIKDPILEVRRISKELKFGFVSHSNLKVPSINAGIIKLKEREFDEMVVNEIRKNLTRFSFIDAHSEHGSFSFTSTVVDEVKGSVFDISASDDQVVIVPKFQVTFESFIELYRGIVEVIDKQAEISLLNNTT